MPDLQSEMIDARQVRDGAAVGDRDNTLGWPSKVKRPTNALRVHRKLRDNTHRQEFAIRKQRSS